ncbi:AcrR family transcriptional regulator [Paenibacillus phyllosphaerae]|uniref:AcrR family transcriptional regulator n=1 Tax=Paenibacillus phyllosphaerae TaxID=274593 RepID=A0A7W5AZV7_9BACL|nr:TetR/AcrR family transcriptional regulator [Paenibacillus phyllosphaerae]MBB3111855.1 AcrR family transcriptional regulator [Paenibacillus phyllosphaerae]
MKKGEQTRERIIRKSAELFNQRGYAGSSINDIIAATGIKKGGIYRHFASKDEIAFEAYDYASGIVGRRFAEGIAQATCAADRLLAFFHAYEDVVNDPPFIGGCPLLNTAVESDDTHPQLREKAKQSLSKIMAMMSGMIEEGVKQGEFKKELDAESLASFALSLLEGGILLSKLEGTNTYIRMNRDSLARYLEQCCVTGR